MNSQWNMDKERIEIGNPAIRIDIGQAGNRPICVPQKASFSFSLLFLSFALIFCK